MCLCFLPNAISIFHLNEDIVPHPFVLGFKAPKCYCSSLPGLEPPECTSRKLLLSVRQTCLLPSPLSLDGYDNSKLLLCFLCVHFTKLVNVSWAFRQQASLSQLLYSHHLVFLFIVFKAPLGDHPGLLPMQLSASRFFVQHSETGPVNTILSA